MLSPEATHPSVRQGDAPEWLFLGIIGLVGAALLGVGFTLRATGPATRPATAPQRA